MLMKEDITTDVEREFYALNYTDYYLKGKNKAIGLMKDN